jgi:hypothetical protein
MSKRESIFQAVNALRSRFGVVKTLKHVMYRLVNRFLYFDCLNIIVLNRENLKPLDVANLGRLGTRFATLEDLREMQKQGCWDTNQKKIDLFNQGDACLLSYVDNKLAGYTWAHINGRPEIVPGLRISVPDEYLYNFAGFTLPDYRGYGLQSFRHHELLNHPRWKDKKGLLGFVIHTNYSSRRGQEKSGYQRLGNIWLIGAKSRFYALIDKNLQRMGIRRIKCTAGA